MAIQIVYGPGGFDPTKPDNNVVERITVPDQPEVTDPLTVLLDELAKATTLTEVREAAAKAAEAS